MQRYRKLVLVLGCLAATAALVALVTHKPEPRYQGHILSHWLAASARTQATNTFRVIAPGILTNAAVR